MVLDLLVVEDVVGEEEGAVVGLIDELTLLVVGVVLEFAHLDELEVDALVAVLLGLLLARSEGLALHAVLVVLARQRTRLKSIPSRRHSFYRCK